MNEILKIAIKFKKLVQNIQRLLDQTPHRLELGTDLADFGLPCTLFTYCYASCSIS